MSTSALVIMLVVQVSVTVMTAYLFYKIFKKK